MKMGLILDEYYNTLLFLEQNLNQNSITSLEGNLISLRTQTVELSTLIDRAIVSSEQFLSELENEDDFIQ